MPYFPHLTQAWSWGIFLDDFFSRLCETVLDQFKSDISFGIIRQVMAQPLKQLSISFLPTFEKIDGCDDEAQWISGVGNFYGGFNPLSEPRCARFEILDDVICIHAEPKAGAPIMFGIEQMRHG